MAKAEKRAGHAGGLLPVAQLMRKIGLDDDIGNAVKTTVGDKAVPCSRGPANRHAANGGALKAASVLAMLH
jgi:hypothetical protein